MSKKLLVDILPQNIVLPHTFHCASILLHALIEKIYLNQFGTKKTCKADSLIKIFL